MIRPSNNPLGTGFGWQPGYPLNQDAQHPGMGFHKGQDFDHTPDNRVYMPEMGKVTCVKWDSKTSEGNVIYINVGNRRHALCHLEKFLVNDGDLITEGQPIGIMGNTGYAQGKHLHWAVSVAGELVNPLSLVNEQPQKETPMPNDGDITNAKRAATGIPDYQPTGPEFDYYKELDDKGQPVHGWHDLMYDTINGMNARLDSVAAQVADLTKKLEVAQASNPNSDATKWQTLKTLIKSLLS